MRYCSRNSPAATYSGRSCVSPSARSASPSSPFSRGTTEHGVHLAGEAARAEGAPQRVGPADRLRGLGEQLAEHDVLLRCAEQAQRAGVQLGWGVAPDQAVGEGVEGRAHRGRGGPPEARGDPVTQLLGGLAAERQGQHRLGAGATVLDAVHDGLDQGRGLAGAGTRQHEQRPAGVVDDRLLELVEDRWRHRARRAGARAGRPSPAPRASPVRSPVSPGHPNTCHRQPGTGGLTPWQWRLPEGVGHVDPTGRAQRGALVEVVRPGLVAVAGRQRARPRVRRATRAPVHRTATSPGRRGGARRDRPRRRGRRRWSPDPQGPAPPGRARPRRSPPDPPADDRRPTDPRARVIRV